MQQEQSLHGQCDKVYDQKWLLAVVVVVVVEYVNPTPISKGCTTSRIVEIMNRDVFVDFTVLHGYEMRKNFLGFSICQDVCKCDIHFYPVINGVLCFIHLAIANHLYQVYSYNKCHT